MVEGMGRLEMADAAFRALSGSDRRRVLQMTSDWASESLREGFADVATFASALHGHLTDLDTPETPHG